LDISGSPGLQPKSYHRSTVEFTARQQSGADRYSLSQPLLQAPASAGEKDRLRNMADAFEVKNSSPVAGMRLALIDDVVTTGATARAATSSLLKAGAQSVDIWCIARTGWHIEAA